MSIPESGAAPERAVPKNRRHKELSFPSSPQALALTPCSADTSLIGAAEEKSSPLEHLNAFALIRNLPI